MQIKLFKKPKNPIIVEGFPGFGLVGTISTEFLIDHLNTELIGKIWMDDLPAMVAIHAGKVVEPLGIFYNKKNNIVIIHGVTAVTGVEWKIANAVIKIANDLKAKEIISLEGVSSQQQSKEPKSFYYSDNPNFKKKFKNSKITPLKEGIIMGVTGIMLLRAEGIPSSGIFVETHSGLPDSKAAAKMIEVLDMYLGLKVDYKPLLAQAAEFEKKLKTIMDKSQEAIKATEDKRKLNYLG